MKKVSLDELPHEGVSHDPAISKRVMLRRGDVPHVTTFARATLLPSQTAHAHEHPDMYEVFFAERGEGKITVDGVPHRFAPGVCVVVEPGERHEVTNDSDAELVLSYFGIAA